jgi:hypothetical protein
VRNGPGRRKALRPVLFVTPSHHPEGFSPAGSRRSASPPIKEAERRIGKRDPDDVETLALALHLGLPVWSNNDDFEDAGVTWYTTAEVLKRLDET